MNNLKLNENILLKLLDEKNFKNEVYAALNRIIDEELSKDEPDCDLIDECINAIEEIEKSDYSNVIAFAAENRNNPHISRRMLGIIIAAAFVLSAGISAVAINRNFEKKKTEENTVSNVSQSAVTTTTTVSTSSTMASSVSDTTSTSLTQASIEKILLEFNDKFKDEYVIGEKLSLNGINVKLQYSDGSKKYADINDCRIITDKNFGKAEKYETVAVSYGGKSAEFKVRFLRDEDTKVLNSIYAEFPDGFDFTAKDINSVDLNGMTVYAVYSDESERKLTEQEYTVQKELTPDGKAVFITINHQSVSTTFGIKERSAGDKNEQ